MSESAGSEQLIRVARAMLEMPDGYHHLGGWKPIVRDLVAAHVNLRAALEAVSAIRPTNWEDEEDADQVAAWRQLDAQLTPHQRPQS